MTPSLQGLLRQIDYWPKWLATTLGVGGSAVLAGALLMWAPPVVAGLGFVVLLGGALALAFSGEPISVVVAPQVMPPVRFRPEMIRIPAGSFWMGSPEDEEGYQDNEGPVHEVRVSAFEMMAVPVTRCLYREVVQTEAPEDEADMRPMTEVTWYDAVRFCNRLSEREGLMPCYRLDEDDPEPVVWDHAADGYRLPTEAEWEYACRAGSQTRFFFGDDVDELERYAWGAGFAHPVGEKRLNGWGLYDMHGNVLEWCWDWYGEYTRDTQMDPSGPQEGTRRAACGIDNHQSARHCRRRAHRHRFDSSNPVPTPRHCHACHRAPKDLASIDVQVALGHVRFSRIARSPTAPFHHHQKTIALLSLP